MKKKNHYHYNYELYINLDLQGRKLVYNSDYHVSLQLYSGCGRVLVLVPELKLESQNI